MTTPTFKRGIGKLAVDRFDFEQHLNGTGFRQDATTVDIANPSSVYGSPANVEVALEDINTFIVSQINNGAGFCIVPDGYDTYHAANGTINFDTAIPSLDTFLNPLFSAIINNTALPQGFERIKFGGFILIKAGTYIVKNTITIPPSITLLGEGYGTKIVNATSLDTSTVPPTPKISPTPAPIFTILADGYRSSNDAAVDPNMFIFSRETSLINMVISDNFVEPTALGDTFYKVPQNKTSSLALNPPALISQQLGSNLSLRNVMGLGRVNFSSGKIVNKATGTFIGIDNSTTETETFCKLDNCFLDGFSIPLDLSAADGYGQDFLEIKNCRMRAYGYFNGNSTDGYDNTVIKCDVQNVSISGSLFYGNATNVTSLLYLTTPPSTPSLQDRSKIIIVGNQVIIDKASSDNSINSTWVPLYFSSAIANPSNVMTSVVYGNDFQDTFDIYVDDGYQYGGSGLGSPQLSINRNTKTTTLQNDHITLDGYDTNIVGNTTLTGNTTMPSLVGTTIMGSSAILSVPSSASIQLSGLEFFAPGSLLHLTGTLSSTALLLADGYSELKLSGAKLSIIPTLITTSTYTIDSSVTPPGPGYDVVLLIDTSAGPSSFNIKLPAPTQGRYLVFNDIGNMASTHNIFILQHASEAINKLNATYVFIVNKGSVTLLADGVNWWIVGKSDGT